MQPPSNIELAFLLRRGAMSVRHNGYARGSFYTYKQTSKDVRERQPACIMGVVFFVSGRSFEEMDSTLYEHLSPIETGLVQALAKQLLNPNDELGESDFADSLAGSLAGWNNAIDDTSLTPDQKTEKVALIFDKASDALETQGNVTH